MKHPLEVAIAALAPLSDEDRALAVRLAASQNQGAGQPRVKRKYKKRTPKEVETGSGAEPRGEGDVSTGPVAPPVRAKLVGKAKSAVKPVAKASSKSSGKSTSDKLRGLKKKTRASAGDGEGE